MMVRLHKNATTTPATRRYIQSSNLPVRRLARELGVSEDTIRRWKKRTDVEDRPHTAHRLQTNGMVERFNGRISEVLATHRFDSREALEATIHRYVWLYNHHIPQKALGHVPPIEAMKRWYADKPELFIKVPRNRPGPDI